MTDSMAEQDPQRVARIVWFALLGGLVAFFVVATMVGPGFRGGGHADPELGRFLTAVMAVYTLVVVGLSRLVPRLLKLAVAPGQAALTRTIVGSALCEGAGLFGVVVWLLSGSPVVLAPLLLALGGLLAWFPGDGRWAALVESAAGAARPPRR